METREEAEEPQTPTLTLNPRRGKAVLRVAPDFPVRLGKLQKTKDKSQRSSKFKEESFKRRFGAFFVELGAFLDLVICLL
jgi:hypothetical protein